MFQILLTPIGKCVSGKGKIDSLTRNHNERNLNDINTHSIVNKEESSISTIEK